MPNAAIGDVALGMPAFDVLARLVACALGAPDEETEAAGIKVFVAGNIQPTTVSESLVVKDAKRGIYKHLILKNDQVTGAVLYGDTTDGPWYAELMKEGRAIGPLRDQLLFGEHIARPRA
jgi:NAD(P)H-nitrite reductase large subunit